MTHTYRLRMEVVGGEVYCLSATDFDDQPTRYMVWLDRGLGTVLVQGTKRACEKFLQQLRNSSSLN